MSIATDTIAANIIVEPVTGDIDLIVDQPVVIVDAPATAAVIVEVSGTPGPAGPSAVSADAGNTAILGSDSLIYVPLAFDEATADARYINGAGDTMPGLLSLLTSPQVIGPSGGANMSFRFADSPDLYVNSIVNSFSGEPSWHAMEFYVRWNGQDRKLLSLRGDGAILFHGVPQFLTPGNVALSGSLSIANDAQDAAVLSLGHSDPNYRTFIRTSTTGAWITGNVSRYTIKTGIDGIEREIWRAVADGSMALTGPASIGPGGTPGTVPLTVKGIAGQSANLLEVRDAAGAAMFYVGPTGNTLAANVFNAPIVRVPGIDLWNDGTIYFQAQAVSLGSVPGALRSNSPLLLPGAPTDPLHAATKAYVDSATPVLPPESDINLSVDYGNTAAGVGSYNTVIGAQAAGSGAGAYVLGCRATGGGTYAGAFGYGAAAMGNESIALGHNARADLAGGVAIGTDSVGAGAHATAADEMVLGTAKHTVQVPGTLILTTDPAVPLEAATKQYVDNRTPPMIVLGPSDPVPGGTPAGTVIVRTV